MTFIDKQNRGKLNEGRSRGISFAFCKRDGETLETVDPISACKDYLSDRVYSEATGKQYTAYGLTCTKQDIFSGGKAYLVMAVLKAGAKAQTVYPGYDEEIAALEKGFKSMELLMQKIEEMLKVEGRTVITKIEDNKFMVELPLFWVEATYLISLYALVLRNAIGYVSGDPIEFLAKIKNEDAYYMGYALPKLSKFIQNGVPKQDWSEGICWHNYGIVGFNK